MPEILTQCPVCSCEQHEEFIQSSDYFLTGNAFTIVKCTGCGMLFTNPRPIAEELGQYYQSAEYISHSNSQKGVFNTLYQQVRNYTLSRKRKLIGRFHPTGSILDIGCATGQFLNMMKSNGWNVKGIEPDEKTRQYAIDTFHLDVIPETDIHLLPPSSFNVITMWHVLEHVSDLHARMSEIKKLLTPDGTLIIAVPNCEARDAKIYGKYWAAYDLPRHLYHFSTDTMARLLGKYRFRIRYIKPMRFDAFYVSLLSEKYKYGKIRWLQGLWNGFCSNLKAEGKNRHSSLIFVIKNEPA